MSKSKSTGHARHLFALGSVILLITVFGLYGAHYVARVSNVGPVIDDKIAWQPAAAENDPWTLHPEQHVFRDAKTILVKWNITLGQRAPDGVTRPVYSINGQIHVRTISIDMSSLVVGQFPGPTIETRSGDELVVEVQNSLENDEDLAIHWHGLSMKGKPTSHR
jgi:FtsP/CotA-like multicopper oxidase with cupredoxin domain